MKKTKLISIFFLVFAVIALFFLIDKIGNIPKDITVNFQNKKHLPISKEKIITEDVLDEIYTYNLDVKTEEEIIKVTKRIFPNDDYMIFIEAQKANNSDPIRVSLPVDGKLKRQYRLDNSVEEIYPYRKPRALEDPLSTRMDYLQFHEASLMLGPQIYYNDISEADEDGHISHVLDFQREVKQVEIEEGEIHFTIDFDQEEEHYSTWMMFSEEGLFENEDDFRDAHAIGVDEFRWITPSSLWSHGLTTIHPSSETAFIRSLVRQSGRSSSIKLANQPTRFWENMSRHQFVSLELSRNEDGLWYSDYISTWLQNNYGIGAHYVDSRHNDNIFRGQLRRADLLGYTEYLQEVAVYADFLLAMAEEGFVIEVEDTYYIIDYFNFEHKTHVSLNHALSIINYLYDAYLQTANEKYLASAEDQLKAIEKMEADWINSEDGEVNYQLNLDGTVSAKDYNLVTYYDLLYTQKLREEISLEKSLSIENILKAKEDNLQKLDIVIEGNMENVEDFIGLIE